MRTSVADGLDVARFGGADGVGEGAFGEDGFGESSEGCGGW